MVNKRPYFQFRRVDTFDRDKNRKDCFDVLDMNGTDLNFKLVLASNCSSNIDNCLDDDGTLKEWDEETGKGVEILYTLGERDGLVPLLYTYGINGEGNISINTNSVVYELPDGDIYVKGIFLVSYANGSGYVMAYSINNVQLEIKNNPLILNTNGLVWGNEYTGGE